jgi:excisionase family DNA binding protein
MPITVSNDSPLPRELLTPTEAADLLRVRPRTIRKWIDCGRLPAFRTDPGRGGRLRVRRSDLLRVLQPVSADGAA